MTRCCSGPNKKCGPRPSCCDLSVKARRDVTHRMSQYAELALLISLLHLRGKDQLAMVSWFGLQDFPGDPGGNPGSWGYVYFCSFCPHSVDFDLHKAVPNSLAAQAYSANLSSACQEVGPRLVRLRCTFNRRPDTRICIIQRRKRKKSMTETSQELKTRTIVVAHFKSTA